MDETRRYRVDPADAARGADDEKLDVVHRVGVAVAWIERASGALPDVHQRVGHG